MVFFSFLMLSLLALTFGISDNTSQPLSRVKRLFTRSEKNHWTNGIVPYKFDESLPKTKRTEYIQRVFALYERYSCIRFVTWTTGTRKRYNLDHNNYLVFEPESRCYSYIGNTRKNGQRIYCCGWKTCLHEIGHALGMLHEHRSPIRDNFIRINYENIITGLTSEFHKVTNNIETFGLYDYDSIMHYGLKAWGNEKSDQTISLFDPETKPASLYADKEQYFYMFKEINYVYKCTDKCKTTCYNGGYPAIVNKKCSCRCPEGLNTKKRCKSILRKDYKCGGVVTLSTKKQWSKIRSPKILNKSQHATCFWYIKSPPNTRVLLDFPTFKIHQNTDSCRDEVAVKSYLPGMYGASYCGYDFKKTVQSTGSILGFTFTQTPARSMSQISTFEAKVSFIPEDSYCYNLDNKGVDYIGSVNYTDDSTACLSWDRVTMCKHHMFNIHDGDKRLERNYCRNPDNAAGPWCYISTTGCVRKYCDACNLGVCKDHVNCEELIKKNPKYCQTNSLANRNCRKSCGFCARRKRLSSVSETFCEAPKLPPDAAKITLKNKYRVGENVKVVCKQTNTESQDMTCLSNGQWTKLRYVCGTCLTGWSLYRDTDSNAKHCYKLFKVRLNRVKAEIFCNDQHPGSTLVAEEKFEHNFVTHLIRNEEGACFPVWLGIHRIHGGIFKDKDGREVVWTNWANDHPRKFNCASISSQCNWVGKGCRQKQNVLCQYPQQDPLICSNQRSDCYYIQRRNAKFCTEHESFAMTYCAKTCNLC